MSKKTIHQSKATLDGELARAAQEGPFATVAVVLDGYWFEQGETGWRSRAKKDKGRGVWCDEERQIWEEIPEDAVVVVDCHI